MESAIDWYKQSVDSQDAWPQFHHICYWELFWANTYGQNWAEAAKYSQMLYDESKWSKCSYAYHYAATFCMMEEQQDGGLTQDQKNRQIELMK